MAETQPKVNYVDFDVTSVPILILYKQERSRYFMEEVQMGLISTNEYREATSRKKVESDLADSLLMNPNLTPIANTEKKMEQQPQAGMPGMPPGAPGMPPEAGQPPMDPTASPLDPNTMAGALAQEGVPPGGQLPPEAAMPAAPDAGMQNTALPPGQQLSAEAFGPMETKEDSVSLQRWSSILNRALERTIERQQRVTLEKMNGVKAKKALSSGSLAIDMIFNTDIWDRQFEEDIRPVLSTIISDSSEYSEKSLDQSDVVAQLNAQMQRFKDINESTYKALNSAYVTSLNVKDDEQRSIVFRASCVSIFSNILAKSVGEISSNEARRAWTFAN